MVISSKINDDSIAFAGMKLGTFLVLSLFVCLSACARLVPAWSEWIALGLMICAGIPHGSFDLRVAEAKWRAQRASRRWIVVGYLGCVIGMSALCVFTPALGLALFLIISAIHFYEGESRSAGGVDRAAGALFGIGAIVTPIGCHSREAQDYMSYFVPPWFFASIAEGLQAAAYVVVILMGCKLLRDIFSKSEGKKQDVLQRFVCMCGWLVLPPLAGFAVWFIGRHSRQHLEVCKEMFRVSRIGIPLDFALISLLAIIGLLPFAMFFDFSDINQLFAASISLIAGLTLPHMIVTHRIREVIHAEQG